MQINNQLEELITLFVNEDLGEIGDITSNYTIEKKDKAKFVIVNKEEMVLCGVDIALFIFKIVANRLKITEDIHITKYFNDGKFLHKNQVIISGTLNIRLILAAERLVLNLLQHLSAIATKTNKFVLQLSNNKTKILDTRKTIPGIRKLQKYAVKTGGGFNHRLALYDAILIKDNHIIAGGGISNTIQKVKSCNNKNLLIEIECDTLSQVKIAAQENIDIIMLDNMNLEQIKKAIHIIDNRAKIEVSGGVTLSKIKNISALGVDYISVGELTNSITSIDIGLDILD